MKMRISVSWLKWLWPLGLLLLIFWDAIATSSVLFHGDWAPYFPEDNWMSPLDVFVFHPRPPSFHNILWTLMPMSVFHNWFYVIFTMAITGAAYAFLRVRRVPSLPSFLGGMALGFAGYHLTLVSGGHRWLLDVILVSVLLLICIERGTQTARWFYFTAAGVLAAYGFGTQPDVMALLSVILFAYGVAMVVVHRRCVSERWKPLALGLLLAAVVFGVAIQPAYRRITTRLIPERQAVSQSQGTLNAGEEAQRQWDFCTSWSLPTRDAPELIVPLLFGVETGNREAPFWGELGRSPHFDATGQGFRNFRQHTVYLGIPQLILALYAVIVALLALLKRSAGQRGVFWPIWFWLVVGVTGLLLAFGRYLPFYRLFYALPYAETIRCPIKFLHFTDIAVAVLAAYGCWFLLDGIGLGKSRQDGANDGDARTCAPILAASRPTQAQALRIVLAIAVFLGVALLIASMVVKSASASLSATWQGMGFPPELHPNMLKRMLQSLVHALTVVLLTGGLLLWGVIGRPTARKALLVGVGLILIIGTDLSVLAGKYVRTVDVATAHAKNAFVEDVRNVTPVPRVLDFLTSRQAHDPMRASLRSYYQDVIDLMDESVQSYPELLQAMGGSLPQLTRVLQLTGTQYVIGRAAQLSQLARDKSFRIRGQYDVRDGRVVKSDAMGQQSVVLLEVADVLPRAAVFGATELVKDDAEELSRMLAPGRKPSESVIVRSQPDGRSPESGKGSGMHPASITHWSPGKIRLRTPETSPGGMLLLNEPYDADWSVTLDGENGVIGRANHWAIGLSVPPGAHDVVFRHCPGDRALVLSVIPSLLVLLASLAACVVSRRRDSP